MKIERDSLTQLASKNANASEFNSYKKYTQKILRYKFQSWISTKLLNIAEATNYQR
jgi:hypothetical protein